LRPIPLWCCEPVERLARVAKVSPFVATVNREAVGGEHVWQDLPVAVRRMVARTLFGKEASNGGESGD
jgi:hypothetical protein